MHFKIIILSILLSLGVYAGDSEFNFKKGNDLYEKGEYEAALENYQLILEEEMHSPDLYLNMGNAAYQLKKYPEAIYYYEKGLKIAPQDEDLLFNRDLTQKELVDKAEKKEGSGFFSWIVGLTGGSADSWSKVAVLLVAMGFVLLITFILFKKKGKKWMNVFFYTSFITLFFAGASLFLAFIHHTALKNKNEAIVFTPTIEIKNKPSEKSSVAFVLHEGSKVTILSENENWTEIKFGKSKVGWLPKASLKKI